MYMFVLPPLTLTPRRKGFQTHDGSGFVSCLGKRKQKRKIMYSSHHSGEFEAYNIVLYEPVILKENFQYGTLILIGRLLLCDVICGTEREI